MTRNEFEQHLTHSLSSGHMKHVIGSHVASHVVFKPVLDEKNKERSVGYPAQTESQKSSTETTPQVFTEKTPTVGYPASLGGLIFL